MEEELINRKLIIGRKLTRKEAGLLDDCKEIIDVTGKELAFGKSFESLGKEGFVIFYIIQACYDFLRGIFDLWVDRGCHSSYILARSMIEYYIEFCFLLKEDTAVRAQEYCEAWNKGREPFKKGEKFIKFRRIEDRAKSVGLLRLYKKSYKSLCSFSHVNLAGSLIARQDEKFVKDKPKFLLHIMQIYLEMLDLASKKLDIVYPNAVTNIIGEKLRKFEADPENVGERVYPNL